MGFFRFVLKNLFWVYLRGFYFSGGFNGLNAFYGGFNGVCGEKIVINLFVYGFIYKVWG